MFKGYLSAAILLFSTVAVLCADPLTRDGLCQHYQDLKDAGHGSKEVYNKTEPYLYENQRLPGSADYKVLKIINKERNKHGITHGLKAMIAARDDRETVMICFQGTKRKLQLLSQAKSGAFKSHSTFPDPVNPQSSLKVMGYFLEALDILEKDIYDALNKLPASKSRSGRKYVVTGHSLGGALAQLFSIKAYSKLKLWNNPNSRLITFGSPRVGDTAFAARHDALIDPSKKIRVVLKNDLVPHVPARKPRRCSKKKSKARSRRWSVTGALTEAKEAAEMLAIATTMMFKDACNKAIKDYKHASTEVWINDGGPWQICAGDSDDCSNSLRKRDFANAYAVYKNHKMANYVDNIDRGCNA